MVGKYSDLSTLEVDDGAIVYITSEEKLVLKRSKTWTVIQVSLSEQYYQSFFYAGPPNEGFFLTTFYGLYFNQQVQIYFTDYNSCWASEGSFHVLLQLTFQLNYFSF